MVRRILQGLSDICALIAGAAMVAMMCHIVVDVIMRYIVVRPLFGTIEISSYYYMIILVFLSIPTAQMRGEHIFVELFTSGLSKHVLARLDGVVGVICAAFLLFFAWLTTLEAVKRTAMREVVESGVSTLPVWGTRWVVPVGIGLTALILIWSAFRSFSEIKKTDAHGGWPPVRG